MTNLVIRNTEPRLVELPSVEPIVDDEGNVTRDGYIPYRLVPGENDVPKAYWDIVKSNPAVKLYLATGTLVNAGEGKAASLVNNLDSLPPNVALKHIGNCENIAVLNDWKAGTTQLGYKKAIEERIAEIVAGQTGDAVPSAPSADAVDPFTDAEIED
jgi:hypothetical protein